MGISSVVFLKIKLMKVGNSQIELSLCMISFTIAILCIFWYSNLIRWGGWGVSLSDLLKTSLQNKYWTTDPDHQNLGQSGKLFFFTMNKFWQNCASVQQVSDLILKTGKQVVAYMFGVLVWIFKNLQFHWMYSISFFIDINKKKPLTVWYKTKFGSQNLATKFGNHCWLTQGLLLILFSNGYQ